MGLIRRKRAVAREVALDSRVIGVDGTRVRHRAVHCDIAKGGVTGVGEVAQAAVGVVGHKAAAVGTCKFKAALNFKARAAAGLDHAGELVVAAGGRTRHRELTVDRGVAHARNGASALSDRTKGKAAFSCANGDVAARHGEIIHAAGINRKRRVTCDRNFSEVARVDRNSGPVNGGGTGGGVIRRQGAVRHRQAVFNGNGANRDFGGAGDGRRIRFNAAGGKDRILHGHSGRIGSARNRDSRAGKNRHFVGRQAGG